MTICRILWRFVGFYGELSDFRQGQVVRKKLSILAWIRLLHYLSESYEIICHDISSVLLHLLRDSLKFSGNIIDLFHMLVMNSLSISFIAFSDVRIHLFHSLHNFIIVDSMSRPRAILIILYHRGVHFQQLPNDCFKSLDLSFVLSSVSFRHSTLYSKLLSDSWFDGAPDSILKIIWIWLAINCFVLKLFKLLHLLR